MAEMAKKLGGAERAAVLLVSLGEEVAAEILRHMGPKEVQRVGSTIATLKDVGTEQVDGVLEDFLESIGRHTSLGVDSENYLRKTLMQALGEDKAGAVIDRILLGGNVHGLESLKWMEARTVAEMIRLEHPQIIAIILAYLDGDQAAGVLSQLDEKTRVDVLMRVATLDAVQPAALAELNAILERQIAGSANVQSANVGGAKVAAEILNFVDTSIEAELMDQLKETNAELGQEIQDLMFVFDNLAGLDDAAVQTLLREVSSENLLLALKGADESMKEKFFKNMSKRAAEMMRDDLEAKGPVRVSEVESAQKEIVSIARRLADEGQLALGTKGGAEEFV
jgi:flagellar motor switch protein FliG